MDDWPSTLALNMVQAQTKWNPCGGTKVHETNIAPVHGIPRLELPV